MGVSVAAKVAVSVFFGIQSEPYSPSQLIFSGEQVTVVFEQACGDKAVLTRLDLDGDVEFVKRLARR